MGCNSCGFGGGGSCLWIILIIILICCCGCGGDSHGPGRKDNRVC